MPKKNYQVFLSSEDEHLLQEMTHKGNSHSAREILHANILLLTNERYPDKKRSNQEVADIFTVSKTTVNQVRKTYAVQGLTAALARKTRLTPLLLQKSPENWKPMYWLQLSARHQKDIPGGLYGFYLNIAWKTNILFLYRTQQLAIFLIQMN